MSEELLVDIDKNIEMPEYELVLCKPSKEEIDIIRTSNVIYTPEFANIDELEIEVPLYLPDVGGKVRNPSFDLIKGDYLIKFNDSKYFIVNEVTKESTETGYEFKRAYCLSREFELQNKQLVEYTADSRKLYDPLNQTDDNGLEWGILNYIEKLTSWKVDYVNPNLLDVRRSFNIPRKNLIQVFKELQETYRCLFQFDTLSKLINVYEVDDLGRDRGLYISDGNYIRSISENIKSNEIKTRLYLYGRDNVSINSINPTGSFYLDNFNFYKTTDYMSQDLIDALDSYDMLLESKSGVFQGYLDDLSNLNSQIDAKETELFNLKTELAIINDNIDTQIGLGNDYTNLNNQLDAKQAEIDAKQNEIDNINSQIDTVHENIATLRNEVKTENNFTPEQIEQLDSFIKVETYSDSNYIEENVDELYEKGQEILAKISQPPTQFSINVVDFLNIVECQHDWDKLVLGDIVTIQHESLGVDIQVRLVGYTHDVINNSLELEFSNRNSIDDPNVYLEELLDDLSSTSTQVDFSKFQWGQYEEDKKSDIILYVDSQLDAAKNKILAGRKQEVEVSERGIICKDPNNPNQQTRILNNIIAMTDDGWKTAKLALNSNGQIVAENIAGKLGAFAKLRTDQLIVGNDGSEVPLEDKFDGFAPREFAGGLMEISDTKGFVAYKDGTKQEFTQLYPDGLYRVKINGSTEEKEEYFYSLYQGEGRLLSKDPSEGWDYPTERPDPVTIQLPDEYKGRNFRVQVSIKESQYNTSGWGLGGWSLEVANTDIVNATFTVKGYMTYTWPEERYSLPPNNEFIGLKWNASVEGLTFNYTVIA